MLPYSGEPMTGKPSGEPMLGRLPKKREGAQDILHYLDGQPELVRDYMLDLVREAISENNFTGHVATETESYRGQGNSGSDCTGSHCVTEHATAR